MTNISTHWHKYHLRRTSFEKTPGFSNKLFVSKVALSHALKNWKIQTRLKGHVMSSLKLWFCRCTANVIICWNSCVCTISKICLQNFAVPSETIFGSFVRTLLSIVCFDTVCFLVETNIEWQLTVSDSQVRATLDMVHAVAICYSQVNINSNIDHDRPLDVTGHLSRVID